MIRTSLVLVAFCMSPAIVNGDLVLSFVPTSGSQTSTAGTSALATGPVGDTFSFDIVLTQTDPVSPVGTDIQTGGDGIAGVDIPIHLNSAAALLTGVNEPAGVTPSLRSTPAEMRLEWFALGTNLFAPAGSPTSVTIGEFVFTGDSPGTTFVSTINGAGSPDNFLFGDGLTDFGIDAAVFNTASITITVVPEPSAFLFLGCLAIVVGGAKYVINRRKTIASVD